ncbi:hypothetical protein TorRG33x02_313440 [Trema orientale]|uniref:Uncharacterized protein n=1 Tax=Trema orientale TaxID=63057 RepID=A0A2P5BPK3_TREOI|nr:hypothetical protein TorRG33x02_313440 [Trema orientale]
MRQESLKNLSTSPLTSRIHQESIKIVKNPSRIYQEFIMIAADVKNPLRSSRIRQHFIKNPSILPPTSRIVQEFIKIVKNLF